MPHTPGPWRVAFRDGSGPEHVVADCEPQQPDGMTERTVAYGHGHDPEYGTPDLSEQDKADLRLIAAAPTMLAALQKAKRACEGGIDCCCETIDAAIKEAMG